MSKMSQQVLILLHHIVAQAVALLRDPSVVAENTQCASRFALAQRHQTEKQHLGPLVSSVLFFKQRLLAVGLHMLPANPATYSRSSSITHALFGALNECEYSVTNE
jgi:hypothetical protein